MSTSFVNLAALVNYLRRVSFTGKIRIENGSYEAEMIFLPKLRLQAREYDRNAGRISQGDRAFNNILRRSREPKGRIHVIQASADEALRYIKKPFVDERIAARAMETVSGRGDRRVAGTAMGATWLAYRRDDSEKALMLAAELLAVVGDGFERAGVDFDGAFRIACSLLSSEHWFLDPRRKRLTLENERLNLTAEVAPGELFAGLAAVIAHFFDRLSASGRFDPMVAGMRSGIAEHLRSRRGDYEKLSIAEQVGKLI